MSPEAQKLLSELEARLRAESLVQAVTQRPDGALRVDPAKLFVSRAEGDRALEALRQFAA